MLETIQIKILDKEYNMLKPRAMDILKIEDASYDIKGNIDLFSLQTGVLSLVDKKAHYSDYVKNIGTVVHGCDISKLTYKQYCEIMPSSGKIDRVGCVEKVISWTAVEGCKNIDVMSLDEINEIFYAALECYSGVDVLNKLVDDFYTFCR